MTRYLVNWKAVNSRIAEKQEDRIAQRTAFTQLVQEALKDKSGPLKDWGTIPDGTRGYAIFEGSEADMARMANMFLPHIEFEPYPIITADQFMEVLKSS